MRSIVILPLFLLLFGTAGYPQPFNPSLFCFEDAFLLSKEYSFMEQVKLLRDLGYDGIELEGLENYEEKLQILEKQSLKVYMVYVRIDIDRDPAYDVRLPEFIRRVRDRDVTIWLHIHSDKYGPSDPAGDEQCIPILQKLADYAAEYNVDLALYPHSRFWLEKVGDAVRLTQKAGKKNLGAVFNLCHYLKTDDRNQLETNLIRAIPYLSAVSVNGADDGNTRDMDWSNLIRPLGEGSFDVPWVLGILKEKNYMGPVGLQCYDIKGDPAVFLRTSITAWKRYIEELK